MLCSSLSRSKYCNLRECERCPGRSDFESVYLKEFEERNLSEISFEQWISIDRCNLKTLVQSVDAFASCFCAKLEKLITHDY